MECIINAKVNLSLNILGVHNGLHTLDMINASAHGIADSIKVFKRYDGKINLCTKAQKGIGFSRIVKNKNSAFKAARLFFEQMQADFKGADIKINKAIVVGGGLGGSSADAAGALLCLFALMEGAEQAKFDLIQNKEQLLNIAAQTGSDVPYMLRGGFARVGGTGELVEPFSAPHLFGVIAKEGEGVSSRECYAMFDQIDEPKLIVDNKELIRSLKKGELKGRLANALHSAAIKLCPKIECTHKMLIQNGARQTITCGSGACVLGIFEHFEQAKHCAKSLKALKIYARSVVIG